MPCMEPGVVAAHKRAEKAEKEIMELLKTKYGITPPSGVFRHAWEYDWAKGEKQLHEGLKDLSWANSCDLFQ